MRLSTQILWVFGVIAVIALLYVGALFLLKDGGSLTTPVGTPEGSVPNPGGVAPQPIQNPFGKVTARTANYVAVLEASGQTAVFVLASSTKIVDDKGSAAKSGTLVVGALVSIETMDGITANTVRIIPPPPAQ